MKKILPIAALVALVGCTAISAQEVGGYPNAQALNGSERILADQNAATVNITPAQIATFLQQSGILLPTFVNGYILSNNGTGLVWVAPNSATVSSVGLTVPPGLSVTGSPITTSGTLAITTALNGVLIGTGTGFSTANAQSIINLWSGTCNSTTFLRADGTCQTGGGSGGGSVTSVALSMPAYFTVTGSPITSAGTLGVTLNSQSANQVLASPNGSAGTPTFRALVSADIPTTLNLLTSATSLASIGTITTGVWNGSIVQPLYGGSGEAGTITGILKGNGTSAYSAAAAVDVTNLWSGTCSSSTYLRGDGSCQSPAGGGSVTSVALSAPSVFSVSGSPITGSGTLALSFATGQTANEFLATPNGSSGAVGLRAIVAADLPGSITSNTTGNAATATALATTPSQCSGSVALGIAASGNANCTATPTLGASGALGSVAFGNATSGTVTLNTVTGALGTVTASLPANTGTLAELNLSQTWSALQTFSSRVFNTTTGAASVAAELWSGSPYAAGTGTTDFPLLYGNSGSAVSTWSTSGTYFGINAPSGFTGNLLDFHVNGGASVAKLDYQGNLTVTSCTGCGGGGGSGTVNNGTAGNLGYYATTGTTISQLPLGDGLATTGGTLNLTYSSRTVSGTTDTLLSSDCANGVVYTSASAVAVTVPQATGSFANCTIDIVSQGAGAVTLTPTTSTINGGSSITMPGGRNVYLWATGGNYLAAGPGVISDVSTTGSPTSGQVAVFSGGATITGQNHLPIQVLSAASGTSITPNCTYDTIQVTVSTGTAFTFNAPGTCTAQNGQRMRVEVRASSSGAPSYTWTTGASGDYAGSTTVALPSTGGGASLMDAFDFEYNSTSSRWMLMAYSVGYP